MPPLILKTSHHGEWECTTCGEDYNTTNHQPWETADGRSLVCAGCIIQQFEKVLENDLAWPARFGGAALNISDFESILPTRLRLLLLLKVEEYANRVGDDTRLEAVRDQIRSVDYQLCPGCEKIISHRSGCNHMICPCMASFCFICDSEATFDTEHWGPGNCPSFGIPGAQEAESDEEDLDEEELVFHLPNSAAGLPDIPNDWASFRIDIWAWNVAMQISADDEFRRLMQMRLQADSWDPHPLEIAILAQVLRRPHPMHAVTDQQWETLARAEPDTITELLAHGPIYPENPPADRSQWTHRGLLLRPVGGVSNMSVPSGRLAAFMWMHDTIRDWDNHFVSDPRNSAIFQVGPGGDEETRRAVGQMMFFLEQRGTNARITFDRSSPSALIVRIGLPVPAVVNGNTIDAPEAYWRVLLLGDLWRVVVRLWRDDQLDVEDGFWDLFNAAGRAFEGQMEERRRLENAAVG
jgi:hypothetical protein